MDKLIWDLQCMTRALTTKTWTSMQIQTNYSQFYKNWWQTWQDQNIKYKNHWGTWTHIGWLWIENHESKLIAEELIEHGYDWTDQRNTSQMNALDDLTGLSMSNHKLKGKSTDELKPNSRLIYKFTINSWNQHKICVTEDDVHSKITYIGLTSNC